MLKYGRKRKFGEDRVLEVEVDAAEANAATERGGRKPLPRALIAGVLMACAAMTLPVWAQVVGNRTVFLWDGSGATEHNVRLGAWGNGDFEVDKDVEGRGQNVLEVRTRNFYEGVRFQFAQPVSLDNYRQSGLLRFRLRSEKASAQTVLPKGSASSGVPGSSPNPFSSPGYNPYAPGGFSSPSGSFPGGPGFGAPGTTPVATPPVISFIQVVMRLERGALFGQFAFDENASRPDARGWQTFVMPLSQMRATPDAGGGLRTVVVSGNREGLFELGQLALVPNASSNSVSIRRASDPPGTQQTSIEVQPGALRLVADVESGGNDVVVSWNFDADNTGALPEPPLDVLPGVTPLPGAPGSPFGGSPFSSPQPGSSPNYSGRPGGRPSGRPTGGPPFAFPGNSPSGVPGGQSPIQIRGERLDAIGHTALAVFPNEEQDYRVEVTVKDRNSLRETGKASVIVKVRSAE